MGHHHRRGRCYDEIGPIGPIGPIGSVFPRVGLSRTLLLGIIILLILSNIGRGPNTNTNIVNVGGENLDDILD